jgi:NADH-quinone oxidoreductase subunit C/D
MIVDILKRDFPDHFECKNETYYLLLDKIDLYSQLRLLKEKYGFIFLFDITGVDLGENQNRVIYTLINLEEYFFLQVETKVSYDESIDSVKDLWAGADWPELENFDLLGIKLKKRKSRRLINNESFIGHSLRKDFKKIASDKCFEKSPLPKKQISISAKHSEDKTYWKEDAAGLNMASQSTRIMSEQLGEEVSDIEVEIGFQHKGIEKLAESSGYNQFSYYSQRLNYLSSPLMVWGWTKAVEDLSDIDIPPRAKAIRMVIGEISRVYHHLYCLGEMIKEVDGILIKKDFWEYRELILGLYQQLSGHRLFLNVIQIGGVTTDFPMGWSSQCLSVFKLIQKGIEGLQLLLDRSHAWGDRTQISSLSVRKAIGMGLSGPCLRACGINFDLRKSNSYYFYDQIDFEIPLGINGDAYDRYLVYGEEIKQSIRIINQVLDSLPIGKINYFEKNDQDWCAPEGEVFSMIESSNGVLGHYIKSDGGKYPQRVKVRPPSMSLMYSLKEVEKNFTTEDLGLVYASFSPLVWELDR